MDDLIRLAHKAIQAGERAVIEWEHSADTSEWELVMIPTAKAGGLRVASPVWLTGLRRVRLHDSSPTRNVSGSENIGGASEPAGKATKVVSGGTVSFVDMSTVGTGPRCVARINQPHRHTGHRRLVGDEHPELMERPRMQVGTLSASNRYPVADTLEVFEGDTASGVFGFTDQSLADAVVHISCEPSFLSATLAKQPLGGLCFLGLQALAQRKVAAANSTKSLTGMHGAIGVGSDVYHSKIDAQPFRRLAHIGRVRNIDNDREIELAFPVNQISLSPHRYPRQSAPASFIQNGDFDTSCQGQNGHPVAALPRQDALVILNRSKWPKSWLDGLVSLVSLTGFGNRPNRHLRRQSERLPKLAVDEGLEPDFVGSALLNSYFGDAIRRGITGSHGGQQRISLLRRRSQFQHLGHEHVLSVAFNTSNSSPCLKAGASLEVSR